MFNIDKYQHIVWDWNGTLLADVELTLAASNDQRRRYNLPHIGIDQYRELFTFPVSKLYERLGFDLTVHRLEKLCAEWLESYEARVHECSLQPFARDALNHLRTRGLTQSILSLHGQAELTRVVRHHQLEDFFTGISGANAESAYKSKVAAGEAWMRASGLAAESVLVIGDTAHDHEVARALGCDCVLVAAGFQSPSVLKGTGRPVMDDLSFLGQ